MKGTVPAAEPFPLMFDEAADEAEESGCFPADWREPAVPKAGELHSCSLPLWGRWPSAARSDEVVPPGVPRTLQGGDVPLGLREPAVTNAGGLRRLLGNSGCFPWGCANLPFPTRADFVACSETPAASLEVARTCRFQRGRTSSPARKLWFFLSIFLVLCAAPGLPPRPAQGLTPPLHLRKGFHPLTRFRWRVTLQISEPAVSIAGCRASRPETPLFFGRRWAAAQTCAGANAAPATKARGFTP